MIPRCLVIPLGTGSNWQDNELRYSLRSWEMYGEIEDVVIVGHLPVWLKGVTHISHSVVASKPRDIFNKVRRAGEIRERFIFANDDHFLLSPLKSLPYYHSGSIRSFKGGSETFMRYVSNTAARFPKGNFFDVHTPMVVESERLKMLQYGLQDVLFKSLYCNTAGIEGEYMKDLKLGSHVREDEIEALIEGRRFLSTSDVISSDLRKWFQCKYSKPSRWEK